ncbi:hypothetical protein B484DRAFT_395999 [Ochromonadaceae sp. CCMP2298]|nr:hypothetical protein B484DRAFT_395999 [Ochromonadaceae sp. CCMP2298]|mmetsp:Transcript_16468/g.36469  ORF Transcript_16468/g.36469 Transcript_16468/m.36469 type:complete len:216 (+) Transcript_16468:149-796(+)
MSDSGQSESSASIGSRIRLASATVASTVFAVSTFKNLTFEQYQFCLSITVLINLAFDFYQIARLIYLVLTDIILEDNALSLLIVGTILTTINIGNLLTLLWKPTPKIAVVCMITVVVQEVIFVIETVLYFDDIKGYAVFTALAVLFLLLQFFTLFLLFRYWEFLLFNYDDSGEGQDSSYDDEKVDTEITSVHKTLNTSSNSSGSAGKKRSPSHGV